MASRFNIATWGDNKPRFRIFNKESLLAYFDFIDQQEGLEFQDWQLLEVKGRRFVAAPGKKPYEDKDGKMQYPKLVRAAYDGTSESKRNAKGDAFFEGVLKVASAFYDSQNKDSGDSEDDAPAPKKPAAKKKSAAGPLQNIPSLDTDEDLPF